MRTGMVAGTIFLSMWVANRGAEAAALQSPPVYQESGGIVIIEVESNTPTDSWAAETAHAGYTGTSYFAWRGPDMAPSAWGASGLLSYQFNVTTPGQYVVRLHCYGEVDMYKSVFFRMDNDQSFSTPDHNGWVEYFVNAMNQWSWDTRMVAYNGSTWNDVTPVVTLTAGVHTVQFSGRAAGFCMDRISIFLQSISEATAEDLSLPQSSTVGGSSPPPSSPPPPAQGGPKTTGGHDHKRCGCSTISAVPSPGLPLIASILALAALWVRRRGR